MSFPAVGHNAKNLLEEFRRDRHLALYHFEIVFFAVPIRRIPQAS